MHKEKKEKRNWLVRTDIVKYVMNQRKRDCIHACGLVTPTKQVHLWLVILGKRMEIDRCSHVIRSLHVRTTLGYVNYPGFKGTAYCSGHTRNTPAAS